MTMTSPPLAGCSSLTLALTSAGVGKWLAGRKGSFFGLTTSAGMAIDFSQGLAEERCQ